MNKVIINATGIDPDKIEKFIDKIKSNIDDKDIIINIKNEETTEVKPEVETTETKDDKSEDTPKKIKFIDTDDSSKEVRNVLGDLVDAIKQKTGIKNVELIDLTDKISEEDKELILKKLADADNSEKESEDEESSEEKEDEGSEHDSCGTVEDSPNERTEFLKENYRKIIDFLIDPVQFKDLNIEKKFKLIRRQLLIFLSVLQQSEDIDIKSIHVDSKSNFDMIYLDNDDNKLKWTRV